MVYVSTDWTRWVSFERIQHQPMDKNKSVTNLYLFVWRADSLGNLTGGQFNMAACADSNAVYISCIRVKCLRKMYVRKRSIFAFVILYFANPFLATINDAIG